jgi:nitroimidazol reductase NimA-like FMN-containing flavoprotein (pyridoxamine 5'-phosphate oxidase superfamily)
MKELNNEMRQKLEEAQNIWVATVRSDGRPHLAPVWFAFVEGKLYFSTEGSSVKARNIGENEQVALALEDGAHPIICEGTVRPLPPPAPEEVSKEFFRKYEWELSAEKQYSQLFEVTPEKWLSW